MNPDDLNKEKGIDWVMSKLTNLYLGDEIRTIVWGVVTKDNKLETCHSGPNILEKLGLIRMIDQSVMENLGTPLDSQDFHTEGG
jgi:hypothetical protein